MIIDTTVSAMEDQMDKLRRLDEHLEKMRGAHLHWSNCSDRKAKKKGRRSAIWDFLIKQGKDPKPLNYVAFWENGTLRDVHTWPGSNVLVKPTEENKVEEVEQKMLDKWAKFMKYRLPSSQRNRALSE